MEATATRITAEEFLERERRGEFRDRLAELVDGTVVVTHPLPIHGLLQARLGAELHAWSSERPGRGTALMTTAVAMDDSNVFGPDILWLANPDDLREPLPRVPDLAVEIRSPSTWRYDIGEKKRIYEARGLPELWLVDDLSELVYVFRRSKPDVDHFDVALELGRDDVLRSPQLPGFALPLGRLFRR